MFFFYKYKVVMYVWVFICLIVWIITEEALDDSPKILIEEPGRTPGTSVAWFKTSKLSSLSFMLKV